MAFWRRRDRDLDEEIASHLSMAASDRGSEAARREFGNVGLVRETTREMWGWTSWEGLIQDLRYAVRVLGKSPGYALTAVFSLALGIGANTAIFSLIDTIMLKALPVQHPEELVALGDTTAVSRRSEGSGGNVDIFSYPFYKRFAKQNNVFSGVFASGRCERLNFDTSDEHPQARFVSDNYFAVLGVPALLGRTFANPEQSAVVISYDYWKRHFQGAPGVLGRTLRLNGSTFTIIGVTPSEFFGDVVGYQTDLWFPLEEQPQANPGRNFLDKPNTFWLMLMGRLKPGISLSHASTVTNTLGLAILKDQVASASTPAEIKALAGKRIRLQQASGGFSRIRHSFSKPLFMLMSLVALVLLICCTNVANLQLARAASRSREIGLRLAIGASRGRLLRQLMTESLVLATAGAVAGLFIAFWVGKLLLQLVAENHRLPVSFHLSGTSLLFTAGVAVAGGLLFGLAPALYATKASVVSSMQASKIGRSAGTAQQFEKGLVVFQIVLSWVLLFGAGLFIQTLQNLEKSDVGYRRDRLEVVELDPVASGYSDATIGELSRRLLGKLGSMPGIKGVTVSENGLFSGTESISGLAVQGFTPRSDSDKATQSDRVGPAYFETIGTPIVAGRGIEAQDVENAPRVAVINETMQRFYFAGRTAIGRHFSSDEGKTWITIVGVVQDAKQSNLRDPAVRRFYSSYWQHQGDDPIDGMRLEIRTQAPGAQLEQSTRREIKSVDPNLQIRSISAAQTLIEDELLQEKLIAKLSGSFSVLALVLAGIGLYGVMSYLTQRRRTEMGIRMALGATRTGVISLILRETLAVTAVALGIGVAAAILLGRLVASSLYGVHGFDLLTATVASAVIVSAAIIAGWLPAWRAARVDPMMTLRTE